jgi:hypothetical protein
LENAVNYPKEYLCIWEITSCVQGFEQCGIL